MFLALIVVLFLMKIVFIFLRRVHDDSYTHLIKILF